jgi:diaminopimelate epimerase
VNMGRPSFFSKDFPKNVWKIKVDDKEFEYFCVSMWNPHAVIFLSENVWNFDVNKYWHPIQANTDLFPNKINVEFVNVLNDKEIDFRVYERWAGETLACGTGACAAVVAGIQKWFLQKWEFVKVNLKWGNLFIKWDGDVSLPVIMKWPAETVFEGEYFVKE